MDTILNWTTPILLLLGAVLAVLARELLRGRRAARARRAERQYSALCELQEHIERAARAVGATILDRQAATFSDDEERTRARKKWDEALKDYKDADFAIERLRERITRDDLRVVILKF